MTQNADITVEQVEALEKALRLIVADVQDYEAWQRPCYALDQARAALSSAAGAEGEKE